MGKCLVCLVSDQTIPNIIAVADLRPEYLLLLSTGSMEKKGKSEAILKTLALHGADYRGNHKIIVLAEDSPADFRKAVGEWVESTDREWEFVVNLTGGTKLMSIGAYDFFKSNFGSEMIYVPISKNEFVTPFPIRRHKTPTPLKQRLSVIEYLTAYGFEVANEHKLAENSSRAEARKDTTNFIFDHYPDLFPLLRFFREKILPIEKKLKNDKEYLFKEVLADASESQAELLERLGFENGAGGVEKTIFKRDWDYLKGGWLEEYLFICIREAASSGPGADILLNVNCKDPRGVANEFDVVFTWENSLHLVECKSLEASEGDDGRIGGTVKAFLYKLGALRFNFGLTPRAYLATTSSDVLNEKRELKKHMVDRGRQFSTELIPLQIERDVKGYFKSKVFEHR